MGRRSTIPPETYDQLFQHIREGKSAKRACKLVGIDSSTFYKRMLTNEELRARHDAAVAERTELLEEVAYDRARAGSDYVLMCLLKAGKPDVYGDKAAIQVNHTIGWEPMTAAEWTATYGPKTAVIGIESTEPVRPLLPPPPTEDPHELLRQKDAQIAELKAQLKSVKVVSRIVDARPDDGGAPTMPAGSWKL